MQFLSGIILGAIAGWIASKIMNSKGGLIRNIIMGIIGGSVGTALFHAVGLSASGYLGSVIVSVVGACVVIWIGRLLFR